MRVLAPGKLLLAGAYAVLDGAPALVVAVDRHAVADGSRRAESPTPEVLAALPADDAPDVDASPLREGAHKLGLGSSAAMLVASIGVSYARAGRDLGRHDVRDAIFADARRAHAQVQGGGSGVDVAASVYGGALAYTSRLPARPGRRACSLAGLLSSTSSGRGAGDDERMRARVDALTAARRKGVRGADRAIGGASAAAIAGAGGRRFRIPRRRRPEPGARRAGPRRRRADRPGLHRRARCRSPGPDGAAFLPSGAGGGDVFVRLAGARPRPVPCRGSRGGMRLRPMSLDPEGVRLVP